MFENKDKNEIYNIFDNPPQGGCFAVTAIGIKKFNPMTKKWGPTDQDNYKYERSLCESYYYSYDIMAIDECKKAHKKFIEKYPHLEYKSNWDDFDGMSPYNYMEIEEVQIKLENKAKASSNTSDKVIIDKEAFENLIKFLKYPNDNYSLYNNFYIVTTKNEIKYLNFDPYEGFAWLYYNEDIYNDQKKQGLLCKYFSDKSYKEIEKLGNTSAPGIYSNGVKISAL